MPPAGLEGPTFFASGLDFRERVSNAEIARSASFTSRPTSQGLGYYGAADSAFSFPQDLSATNAITFGTIIQQTVGTGLQVIFEHTANQNTNAGSCLAYIDGGFIEASISSGGGVYNALRCTAPAVGRTTRIIISFERIGSAAKAIRVWYDGLEQATTQTFNGIISSNFSSSTMYFMGRGASTLLFRGVAHDVVVWPRRLSLDAIREWGRNPFQMYEPIDEPFFFGVGGGAITHDLSASAQANAAATAALSVSTPLAASGAAQATATAALLKGVSLTAAGLAVASGSASMSHTVPLQASAAAVAVAGAQLALAVSLSAAGLATASASASLTTSSGAELAANGQAQASSSAVLSLVVSLSAAAVAQALASATLAEGKTLAANAIAQAGGSAALQVGSGADLSAAGTAQASAGANLNLTVPLSAAALARAAATGSLLLTVPLTAAAFAQASGSAQFAGDVQMSAQGVSVATATAALQVTAPFARAPEGSRFYQSPPSFRPARTQAGGRPFRSSNSRPPR